MYQKPTTTKNDLVINNTISIQYNLLIKMDNYNIIIKHG